eukprot:6181945-Pleurochrysis_carterae.AAC.6
MQLSRTLPLVCGRLGACGCSYRRRHIQQDRGLPHSHTHRLPTLTNRPQLQYWARLALCRPVCCQQHEVQSHQGARHGAAALASSNAQSCRLFEKPIWHFPNARAQCQTWPSHRGQSRSQTH